VQSIEANLRLEQQEIFTILANRMLWNGLSQISTFISLLLMLCSERKECLLEKWTFLEGLESLLNREDEKQMHCLSEVRNRSNSMAKKCIGELGISRSSLLIDCKGERQ